MIKQNMKHFNRLYVLLDGILIAVALFISWYIRIESGLMPVEGVPISFYEYMRPVIYLVPLYLLLYNAFELYKPSRTKGNIDQLFSLFKANFLGIIIFLSYLYITENVHYSRYLLFIFFIVNIIVSLAERIALRTVLRKYRKKGFNKKHVILVGISNLAVEYSKRIIENVRWGYEIVGVFDNTTKEENVTLYKNSIPVLGTISDLESYLLTKLVDEVIITLPIKEYEHLDKTIEICEKTGVYTRVIPDYIKYIPSRPYVEDIDGLPMISIRKVPLNDVVFKAIKRLIDIIGAFFGLLLISPLMIGVAMAIKISSKGPVLFKQIRVGLNKKHFNMYKFRTMIIQDKDEEKKGWTKPNDNRVTKVGKILRQTSIDELPQLYNVLKGDMSLVGPRPERPQFVEKFMEEIPKYMVKHQVRPGMTGWAQVHGWRGDTSISKRIEFDLYYIENWSIGLDLKILLMTVFKGLINKNAY